MASPPTDPEVPEPLKLVNVEELRPEGYDERCLRPLGLCTIGACDVCWYGPNSPPTLERKRKRAEERATRKSSE